MFNKPTKIEQVNYVMPKLTKTKLMKNSNYVAIRLLYERPGKVV